MSGNQIQILERIYHTPSHPGSFGSAKSLLKYAKKEGYKRGLISVKKYLATQDAYTLHKQTLKRFPRRMTISARINKQFQIDLVDVHKLASQNKGIRYLLTCIDILSRKLYVYPLKTKRAVDVLPAIQKFVTEVNSQNKERRIYKVQSDRGVEFLNNRTLDYFKSKQIIHFFTFNDEIKCGVVERVNRTLMQRVYKFLTSRRTSKYITALPDLVEAYNNRYHRSIGMAPNDVNVRNEKKGI